MRLKQPDILRPELRKVGLFKPSLYSAGKPHGAETKPYIAGHVTDGSSTFTFVVNNTDIVAPVDADGNWKWNPNVVITSVVITDKTSTLILYKINGVTQLDVDYPIQVTFEKCDNTTEAALNYVYHIRGTATSDFAFTLKYIEDGTGTIEEITHNVTVTDNNWDVAYSGKRIYGIETPFYNKDGRSGKDNVITKLEFTDNMSELVLTEGYAYRQLFCGLARCTELIFAPGTKFDKITTMYNGFGQMDRLVELNLNDATFENVTIWPNAFSCGSSLQTIRLESLKALNAMEKMNLWSCNNLKNIYIAPQSNVTSWDVSASSVLTEESVVNLFNAVAADGITLTFHATIGAMIDEQLEIEGSPIYEAYWNKYDEGFEINYQY